MSFDRSLPVDSFKLKVIVRLVGRYGFLCLLSIIEVGPCKPNVPNWLVLSLRARHQNLVAEGSVQELNVFIECQRFGNPHELLRLPRNLQRVEIRALAARKAL